MVEMKRGEMVLGLAAHLASWRAVLVLRTWATYKLWQRKDFHQYSIFFADSLNQSQQTVWESAGGATATEFRKVGKERQERRYADVDRPGANPEPKLGRRGPTPEKQALKECDCLDLRLGLQPADSVDITQDFEWEREAKARQKDSFSGESPLGECFYKESYEEEGACEEEYSYGEFYDVEFAGSPEGVREGEYSYEECEASYGEAFDGFLEGDREEDSEAMDPAGSPSSIRKVADTARPSSSSPSAAIIPGWRSFLCLGNGK